MTAQPCICPPNVPDPRCFYHAPTGRPPGEYVIKLSMINDAEDPEPTVDVELPATRYFTYLDNCAIR